MSRIGEGGRASEQRVAKALGARLRPASGAMSSLKGDMTYRSGEHKFLIESKATINATMAVDLGWLVKIVQEALDNACAPAITLSFTDQEGSAREARNSDWVAMPLWLFKELCPPTD